MLVISSLWSELWTGSLVVEGHINLALTVSGVVVTVALRNWLKLDLHERASREKRPGMSIQERKVLSREESDTRGTFHYTRPIGQRTEELAMHGPILLNRSVLFSFLLKYLHFYSISTEIWITSQWKGTRNDPVKKDYLRTHLSMFRT